MAEFPRQLTEPQLLTPETAGVDEESLRRLNQRGYDLALGLNEYYAGAISLMSQQPHIVEYCPADASLRRFATLTATEAWLTKAGGRAMFLLLERVSEVDWRLSGYGWTGLELEPALVDYPITSAYRLGATAVGQRLSADFIKSIVRTTESLFAAGRSLSLETWQSNPASELYQRLGFRVLRATEPEWRPSLSAGGQVRDSRLYMGYDGVPSVTK